MSNWQTPIFDRTFQDILYAKEQLALCIKNKATVMTDFKGCLNVSDINRIEENTQYIQEQLELIGFIASVETQTWNINGLPNTNDVARIIQNINNLIEAYYRIPELEPLPINMILFEDINAIEQNLYILKKSIDEYLINKPTAGTFYSGKRRLLPLQK